MTLIKNRFLVLIDGRDVTSILDPILLDLSVSRAAGQAADGLDMTLADKDGNVAMPTKRSTLSVTVNGITIFTGFVSDVTSEISKGEGRRLKITGSSVDEGSKAKQRSLRHKDDATFKEVASEFGQKAGIEVTTVGTIADEKRDYWLQQNESYISWGQRMARELGATFKVQGSRGIFVARNEGISASGKKLTSIKAAWGDNLISASIKTIVTKPKYSKVKVSYFDKDKGKRVDVDADVDGSDVDAILREHMSAASEKHAKSRANALKQESMRQSGQGNAEILGNAAAEPEAECIISGVRQGVDGKYRIHSVGHKLNKRSGFTTTLELRQPQDGAGTDKRTKAGAAKAKAASKTSTGDASTPVTITPGEQL